MTDPSPEDYVGLTGDSQEPSTETTDRFNGTSTDNQPFRLFDLPQEIQDHICSFMYGSYCVTARALVYNDDEDVPTSVFGRLLLYEYQDLSLELMCRHTYRQAGAIHRKGFTGVLQLIMDKDEFPFTIREIHGRPHLRWFEPRVKRLSIEELHFENFPEPEQFPDGWNLLAGAYDGLEIVDIHYTDGYEVEAQTLSDGKLEHSIKAYEAGECDRMEDPSHLQTNDDQPVMRTLLTRLRLRTLVRNLHDENRNHVQVFLVVGLEQRQVGTTTAPFWQVSAVPRIDPDSWLIGKSGGQISCQLESSRCHAAGSCV